MRRAMRARELPSAASSASCVGRTFTIANSAATKTPFARINARANSKYQVGIPSLREEVLLYQAVRKFLFVFLVGACARRPDELQIAAAASLQDALQEIGANFERSEERRVGKECRSRW